MEPLLTPVHIDPPPHPIRYTDHILLHGSCFTEHIGQKLERYKYNTLINPFGILYNPVSMAIALERVRDMQYYTLDELIFHDGLYHSLDHHGVFSGPNGNMVLDKINSAIRDAHTFLQKSTFSFISPGTANVFSLKTTGHIVANCHKIPQSQFEHRRLSLEACIHACQRIANALRSLHPSTTIIWTVSPVRHLRDGLIENQRSKATLLLALDAMHRENPDVGCFPAYEIMMDELRDYRYYERDMAHPSGLAIDVIWGRFAETYLHPPDRGHHEGIEKIKRAMEHRFLHDDRAGIKRFASVMLQQIDELSARLPDLHWQTERQYFFHLLEED